MLFKKWHRNLKLEYWKDIEGYEGIYMVSSLGRIKSLERKIKCGENGFRVIKEKKIKPKDNGKGYLCVNLHKNGKQKTFYVHRLVAQAYIPNPLNKPEIDHIDTNPSNNNVKNLRWTTHKENINNSLTLKKISDAHKGEKHPFYGKHHTEEWKKKHSENMQGEKHPMYGRPSNNRRKVRCLETGEIFDCIKYAAEWCGLKNKSSIAKQIQGKRKSAGKHPITKEKLHWTYVD